jgi:hypothetical protein
MMDPEFKLLSDGTLEIYALGQWRMIPGCSCAGIFEYADRMAELHEIVQEADSTDTLESLYLNHRRFKYLCDRVLELNGCKTEWVRPADLGWMLFGWFSEDGTPHKSALAILNDPPEPRHPRKSSSSDGPSDFISLLAAIASMPDTSLEDALKVATSIPARQALGVMDDRAWSMLSDEEKSDVKFRNQADKFREQFGSQTSSHPMG